MSKEKKTELSKMEKPTGTLTRPNTPFGFVRRFTEEMEKIFHDFETSYYPEMFGREFWPMRMEMKKFDWTPPIEVKQKDGKLFINCELPGMKKEDVEVKIEANKLIISGERKEEKEEKGEGYYRSERRYGTFQRYVLLPPETMLETAQATFHNGLLEITMKTGKAEPTARKIDIKGPTTEKVAAKAASA